jgi:hypothetical protein
MDRMTASRVISVVFGLLAAGSAFALSKFTMVMGHGANLGVAAASQASKIRELLALRALPAVSLRA